MPAVLALLPGIPMLPFLALGRTGGARRLAARTRQPPRRPPPSRRRPPPPVKEEPIRDALRIDQLRLELGYGLLASSTAITARGSPTRSRALRRQLAAEMGFVMPLGAHPGQSAAPANTYIIRVKEIEAGRGELRPNMLLVMDPAAARSTCPARRRSSPPSACRRCGSPRRAARRRPFRGYTVVEPQTVITTHLTEVIKDNMAELLSYAETQKLLDELDKSIRS